MEQTAEKASRQATAKLDKVATDTALKAGAEGALTRGLGATALEVVFNPALMVGWEVLKGISDAYQGAWDDIRRPARHIGFAQGWAARLAGLDSKWISRTSPRSSSPDGHRDRGARRRRDGGAGPHRRARGGVPLWRGATPTP